jgi:hypothetical protein
VAARISLLPDLPQDAGHGQSLADFLVDRFAEGIETAVCRLAYHPIVSWSEGKVTGS